MNRSRTGQGPCHANLCKWGLAQSPSCDCGQQQTMNNIVDSCPLTKFEGGLNLLHEADDDAVIIAGIYSYCKTRGINNCCYYICWLCVSCACLLIRYIYKIWSEHAEKYAEAARCTTELHFWLTTDCSGPFSGSVTRYVTASSCWHIIGFTKEQSTMLFLLFLCCVTKVSHFVSKHC